MEANRVKSFLAASATRLSRRATTEKKFAGEGVSPESRSFDAAGRGSTGSRITGKQSQVSLTPIAGRIGERETREWLFALLVGALCTWQFHYTQFSSGFDLFFTNRGDPRFVAYVIEHWYQWFGGRSRLLSPGFFFPAEGTLGYSEALLAYALPYSVLRAAGMNVFPALSAVVIAFTAFSFVSCYVLLHKVLKFHFLAASAGAAFFAFNNPKFTQIGHLQLQTTLLLPVFLSIIVVVARRHETLGVMRASVLLGMAAVLINLQLLTSFYIAWFFILWCLSYVAVALCFARTRFLLFAFVRRLWAALVASGVVFALGCIPFFIIYLPVIRATKWQPYTVALEMTPEFGHLAFTGPSNRIWGDLAGWMMRTYPLTYHHVYWHELQIGFGLIPTMTWLALIVVAIGLLLKSVKEPAAARRVGGAATIRQDSSASDFLGVAIITTTLFYLVGMKYAGGYSPWHLVYDYVPGAKAIRAVARYVLVLALPMSIGFAFLIHHALRRIAAIGSRGVRIVVGVALLTIVTLGIAEQLGSNEGFSVSEEEAFLSRLAKRLPNECATFYMALNSDAREVNADYALAEYHLDAMLVAQQRGIPTLNGYSGNFPTGWTLFQMRAADYEASVRRWVVSNRIEGNVCRLAIDDPTNATATVLPPTAADPMKSDDFFVRQQYRDFMGRDPSPAELDGWVQILKDCPPADAACDRARVSMEISREFWEDGLFIYLLNEVALGRKPSHAEFANELATLRSTSGSFGDRREQRAGFTEAWLRKPDCAARYAGLSATEFTARLKEVSSSAAQAEGQRALPLAPRQENLTHGNLTHGQILLNVVENPETLARFAPGGNVALRYFGYLRRYPDEPGFDTWVGHLRQGGTEHSLTVGFINSEEYRSRFGTPYIVR